MVAERVSALQHWRFSHKTSHVDRLAKQHLAQVDHKLVGLTALRRELSSVIEQSESGTVAECRILKALASQPNED